MDITDIEATKEWAQKENIDFIYSIGSDVAMPTIAKISEELGLPCFVDYDTAVTCNHKNLLREKLQEKKVEGNIPFQIMDSPDEEVEITFPAMMKPSDSQGQRGVRCVNSVEEFKEHFEETIGFSREKRIILEPYVDGDEISVNTFLENGELKFYLVSDRRVWDEYPGGIIRKHIIPSKYDNDKSISVGIRKLVEDVLVAIGLENGPAYFQIKVSKEGKPYLIEVTPRLDGCHMWRAIKYATGVDLLQASMDLLEGKGYSQCEDYNVEPHSLEFMCAKPGTVFSKRNYEVPDYIYLCWYYEEGMKVNHMNGYFEKCGYVIKKGFAK